MKKSTAGTKRRQKAQFEFSAGGIVIDAPNVLMVKVQNLEGEPIWTFPKGHIEKGEKAPAAALREVQEETGYRCEITKPFERVQYYFQRGGILTKKTVTWFLMKALERTGVHDPEEIMETKWIPLDKAREIVKYKSDKTLLQKLSRTL